MSVIDQKGLNIFLHFRSVQFSSVQLLSRVQLFANPWTAAHQAFPSITNSCSPHKPMSIELVMPSNHLICCPPLLLLPSIFPSIRVFPRESARHIRWPKYWSFSFVIKFLILQYHHLCRKGLVFLSRIVKLIFLKHLLDQVTLQFKILQWLLCLLNEI